MEKRIELGDLVKDKISKIEGIVVAITYWLYGCERICIQPQTSKDGEPAKNFTCDEPQVLLLKKKAIFEPSESSESKPTHGDRDDSKSQERY